MCKEDKLLVIDIILMPFIKQFFSKTIPFSVDTVI